MVLHHSGGQRSAGAPGRRKWRKWVPLAAVAGVTATAGLPFAAQTALALPSTHEITANWYGTPTPVDAPFGAAITSEWHINTNDDSDPYTNELVNDVTTELVLLNGVFVSIPSVCKTTGVDPVSSISPDGTTLVCNVGTVREGTATVIQAPVRVSGANGGNLEASGTVWSDGNPTPSVPAEPPDLPITYIHSMDLSLKEAPGSQYQGAVKESRTGGDRTFVQMNFSVILADGSMPGPANYEFPVSVTSSIPGALTGFQWENCVPVSVASRSTGQPYSDEAQIDRTNFPGCEVTPNSGTNYTVSLTGLTYDLINSPTLDSTGAALPGNGVYIASGTVQFSIPDPVQVLTDFNFTATPPPFTPFQDGQSAPDADATNNSSTTTLTPPGGFSNHWTGTPTFSRSPWDANLFVSPGTSQDVVIPVPGIETRQDWIDTYVTPGLPAPPLPLYMQVNSQLWSNYAGAPGTALAGVCTMSQNPNFVITHMDGGGWHGSGLGDHGTAYENYETARYYYTTQTLNTKTETCGQAAPSAMWIEVFPDADSYLEDPRIGVDGLIQLPAGVTAVKMTWDPAVDVSPHSFLRGLGYIDPTAPTTGEGWTIGTGNGPFGNPFPGYPTLNGWGNGSDIPGVGIPIPGSTYGPNTNGYRDAFRLQGATGIITKTTPQTTAEPNVPITYSLTAEARLAITSPPNQTFPVIDILPEGLVYLDNGTASPVPTSVSPDGRTIRWDFVNVAANEEFPITYQAVRPLSSVLAPGTVLTNVAEIQVPGDQRGVESKRARESVVVPSSSSTNFMKTLEDGALSFYGDDSAWLLTIGSQDPINNGFTDTIDILPYVGDGRGTNVSGTTPYTITGVSGPGTIYYTTAAPATVSLDPGDLSNGAPGTIAGATTTWTAIAANTPLPAGATAIRVIGPALAPGATQQIRIGFTTPVGTDCLTPVAGENRPDEVLVNSAGSFAGHTALPMYSSAVATIAGCVDFQKDFESLTRNADGTYDVMYTLTAEGEGNAVLPYDLIDELQYGGAITINGQPMATFVPQDPAQTPATVLNTWDLPTTTLTVAMGVPILDEEVQVFSVLVNVSVDGDLVTWENTNCSIEGNETDSTGLHNTATLTNPDVEIPDEACPEVPFVEHEKNVLSGPTPIGNGLYEVEYQIDVRNLGAGSTMYDLTDEFQFGEAVTIVGTPTVEHINPDPDVIPTLGTWDPVATTIAVVDDEPIAGSTVDGPEVHSYVVTVQVSVDAPTVTFENTDCDLGGDSGTGLHNESTLTVDQHETRDQACVPISEPVHTKTVSAGPTPLGNGTYEVEYTIGVANHGAADTVYDLVDDFKFGSSVTIEGTPTVANTVPGGIATLGTWDAASTTLAIVAGEPIGAASDPPDSVPVVHEYVVTVIVSVDAPSLTVANSDCTPDPGEPGTGLFNAATMTVNGKVVERPACPPISEPSHVKTIASGPTPMGNNTYEVKYAITVSNPGAAESYYDLVDDFKFGSSVTIQGTPTVTSSNGIATLGTWDAAATTLAIVDDQAIAAGPTVHEYIVTVLVLLDPATSTLENTDCNLDGGGSGLFNTATMTVNGEVADRDACAELPHFVIQKGIASGPTAQGNNTYTLDYVVTVTNDGAGSGLYNLTDTLTYGPNVTVISTVISGTGPAGIPTNPGWNGRTDVNVSSGINLVAGGVHTYQVRVTFSVPVGASGAGNDCTLDPGESGTGLLNTAKVNNNGNEEAAVACALVVPPPPPPPPTVPPTMPDTGELPATGGGSGNILLTAGVLLMAGLLVAFMSRRRRRVGAI